MQLTTLKMTVVLAATAALGFGCGKSGQADKTQPAAPKMSERVKGAWGVDIERTINASAFIKDQTEAAQKTVTSVLSKLTVTFDGKQMTTSGGMDRVITYEIAAEDADSLTLTPTSGEAREPMTLTFKEGERLWVTQKKGDDKPDEVMVLQRRATP